MFRSFLVSVSVAMCCASLALADSKSLSLLPLEGASKPEGVNIRNFDLYIDQATATFRSTQAAGCFLQIAKAKISTLKSSAPKGELGDCEAGEKSKASAKDDKDYYLIHVVRWKDQPATDPATKKPGLSLTVDAQNWYLYHGGEWSTEDFSSRDRIYGAKTIYLVYVNLNVPQGADYQAVYTLDYVEKTADNVSHLLSVLSLFLPAPAAGGEAKVELVAGVLWGGGRFENIKYPSNVTVTADYNAAPAAQTKTETPTKNQSQPTPDSAVQDSGGPSDNQNQLPAEAAILPAKKPDAVKPPAVETTPTTPAATTSAAKPTPATANTSPVFDNEAKYWWDVSVAVPLHKISETSIDTTANTITPKQVTKQNAFAALDLYPIRVDTKRAINYTVPHFVGGVMIGSQPLHHILLAAGFGPAAATFYVGALLVKQTDLSAGSTVPAGTPVNNSYSTHFAFGINLQVKAFQTAVANAKSK